ncbi:MAG: molybdenum ABC transporter ATP-binding protein [Paracoccaceae bacterium]|nr:molybdenum ABC transporter ATP-binding protein [Paracoccaceae bacterium]
MTLAVDITRRLGAFDLAIRFEAPPGVTAVFGRSGAGKTSLVNAVAGLLRPDRGRIALHGRVLFDATTGVDLPAHRRRIGYVFQDGRLFPHLSVRRNLLYGAPPAADPGALARVAALLDISDLLNRAPAGLSGGEKQRVAIGRALLSEPQMLLMDEPLASLDADRKSVILPYLERLRDETGLPIFYVSHAIEEVARLANTVVILEGGAVGAAGPATEVFADPANVRRLGLRDAGAVLAARVVEHHSDGLSELETSGARLILPRVDAPVGSALRVRIAARDVILATAAPTGLSALNVLPVTVVEIRSGAGPGAVVQLKNGIDLLIARVTKRSVEALGLRPGDAVFAVIKSVSVARADVGGAGAPKTVPAGAKT